jgi:hypothetical protein
LPAAAQRASSELTMHTGSLNWVATSSWAQKHAIQNMHPWRSWMQIPTHLVEPVDINAPEWLFEPPGAMRWNARSHSGSHVLPCFAQVAAA